MHLKSDENKRGYGFIQH